MSEPIGVILAGGRGRRLGGEKALVELCGRPLISYPLAALRQALPEVALLVKSETRLPSLPGVTVWVEPDLQFHPLVGILRALGLAGGRPVVVCALDLPFVSPRLVRRLALRADARTAALAASQGAVQPLLGRYAPAAAPLLSEALRRELPAREAALTLAPALVEVEDPAELFNVNTPEDLLQAAALLSRRSPTWSGTAG